MMFSEKKEKGKYVYFLDRLRNSLSKPDDASHFDSINNRHNETKVEATLVKAHNLHLLLFTLLFGIG